ncbi:MAG: trypsin-like peptidase domain-containing protein [bacterium]|nr:trypsin-like peptidase domain-containing protein [bacterium]
MDNLTKTQLVLLVLLVSFVTSLVTGIVTVTLVSQNPPALTQTIQRVIERSVGSPSQTPDNIQPTSQEELVVRLVKNITPAVASVIATKDIPVVEQYFINPFEGDEFFRQFLPPDFLVPQFRQKGTEKRQISAGTGFFLTSDGILATNRHVVEDTEAEYSIIMNDGRKLLAKVLARDPVQDVAILKVEGNNFSFVPLGNSDNLQVGQTVVAIGNALGEFQNTVSVGVISGLRRTIMASGSSSGPERLQQVIQTDAAINPGNSGGPLLDLRGRAIGINTAMAQGAENVGFALPINVVKKALTDVKTSGRIIYPFLGVRYIIITPGLEQERKLPVGYGALLAASGSEPAVLPASPGEKAGLKDGDIVLEFGGVKVDQDNTLGDLISKKKVGDKVSLKVLRQGRELELHATLEERQ